MKNIIITIVIVIIVSIFSFLIYDNYFQNNPQNQEPGEKNFLRNKQKDKQSNIPIERAQERITKKPFGIKVSPENSPITPERFSGYHTGIDYEIFEGEENVNLEVFAICSGELLRKEIISGYGGVLLQKCELKNQLVTVIYGHIKLNSVKREVGENIEKGNFLTFLGDAHSAETDGERKHLHLGIHRGEEIDWRGYVQNQSELGQWINFEKL